MWLLEYSLRLLLPEELEGTAVLTNPLVLLRELRKVIKIFHIQTIIEN